MAWPFSSPRTTPRNSSHAPCVPVDIGGEMFSAIGPRVRWISVCMQEISAARHGRDQCHLVATGKCGFGRGVFVIFCEPDTGSMCRKLWKLLQQFRPKLFAVQRRGRREFNRIAAGGVLELGKKKHAHGK